MAARIRVYIMAGDLTLGLWCPYCLLPSGYSAPLYRLSPDGVSDHGTLRKCYDCDSPLPADE